MCHNLTLKETIKNWENLFIKTFKINPTKEDLKKAPREVKKAYAAYYEETHILKTIDTNTKSKINVLNNIPYNVVKSYKKYKESEKENYILKKFSNKIKQMTSYSKISKDEEVNQNLSEPMLNCDLIISDTDIKLEANVDKCLVSKDEIESNCNYFENNLIPRNVNVYRECYKSHIDVNEIEILKPWYRQYSPLKNLQFINPPCLFDILEGKIKSQFKILDTMTNALNNINQNNKKKSKKVSVKKMVEHYKKVDIKHKNKYNFKINKIKKKYQKKFINK